jgi:hypothetical protein
MDTAQALAIAAAAFVTALTVDTPAFPQHITARTEAAITSAWEHAIWQAEVEPVVVLHDAAYVPAPEMQWDACEAPPKAVRL